MTSSTKVTWGIMLLISGWLLVFLGIALSFTGIGACLGIPMIVLGMPLWIIGAILMWQGKVKRAEEAIAAGVRQGIQQAQATISGQQAAVRPPTSTPPPPPPASEQQKAPLPPPPPPKAPFVPPSPQPPANEPAKVSLPPATSAQPQPPAPASEPVKSPQSISAPVPLTSQKPISKIVWIGIVVLAVIALGGYAWYSKHSSKASKQDIVTPSIERTDNQQSKSAVQGSTVIFADNFNDNSIDLSKWKASGNTVTEANQMMQVLTTVTDAGGSLASTAIPVNSTGKVTITRRVRLHYGNSYFMGQFGITIGTLPMFSIRYANMDYADGSTYMRRIGFFIARNNARPDLIANQADVSAAITPLWDTWFNEKITYNPITGIMEYFINNVSQLIFNVGTMPRTTSPTMSLNINAWGWYTGHSLLFSDLQVTQKKWD